VIRAEKISFRYGTASKFVFQDYSFEVKAGEVLSVLGPNGQGKTTLVKTLLDLLPLSSGMIHCQGHKAYVPQNALTPFDYDVREMVVMGCNPGRGMFSGVTTEDYKAADHAIEKVGMTHLARQGFASLSGGQKQMVLVARALASRPDIMILDEPTSALDFKNQSLVLNIMKQIASEGKTVIFTTHCPHQALYVSDTAMIMQSSDSCFCGPAEEVLTNNHLSRLYGVHIHKGSIETDYKCCDFVIPVFDNCPEIFEDV